MEHSPKFLALVEDARQRIREITLSELRARQARQARSEPLHLIDVREDREWEQGRLPGARHISRGILERDIEKAVDDTQRELILYCGGGFRSALAADNLQRMGYQNVLSLTGGYRGWVESGGPVEK